MRMINDIESLLVSRAGGSVIQVAAQCVMMEFGGTTGYDRQKTCPRVEVDNQQLGLCPFTIVISIGHVDHAIGYTWELLQLNLRLNSRDPSAFFLLKCAVANAINYNI